jgi:O-antigen ligase
VGVGTIAGLWPSAFLPITGFVLLSAGLLTSPALGVGLLIAARSSLDHFVDRAVLPGFVEINLASALAGIILILCVIVLAVRMRFGRGIEWGGAPALLWGGWVAFSLLGAGVGHLRHGGEALGLGLREVIRLATMLAIYLLVVNTARTRRDRTILLGCLLLSFLIPALVGYHELLTGRVSHEVYRVGRLSGTFVHPNPFGMYLTLIIILAAGLWADVRGRQTSRVAIATLLVSAAVLLVFTLSRSAWAVLLLSLGWWVWGLGRRARIAVVLSLVVIAMLFGGVLRWRFQDLVSEQPAVSGLVEEENSLVWRLRNYGLLILTWRESPVFGHGTYTTVIVNPQKSRSPEGLVRGAGAHNELIRVLVEHGILGVALYLAFIVGMLRSLTRFARQQPAPEAGGYPALGRVAWIYFASLAILGSMGTEYLSHTALFYVLMALMGVVYAAREESGSTEPIDRRHHRPTAAGSGEPILD